MEQATEPILVLGIGNVLWADEGFGVHCVQALAERCALPQHVTALDGGTLGMGLLPYVVETARLIIFDAVDYGLAPGTLHCVAGDDVPRFLGAKKLSLHQSGFQEVLAAAELLGRCPRQLVLIGCQPEVLDDFGGSLRPVVRAALGPALEYAVATLRAWGVPGLAGLPVAGVPAPAQPAGATRFAAQPSAACERTGLDLARYEAERPSAHEACRVGDARILERARRAGLRER